MIQGTLPYATHLISQSRLFSDADATDAAAEASVEPAAPAQPTEPEPADFCFFFFFVLAWSWQGHHQHHHSSQRGFGTHAQKGTLNWSTQRTPHLQRCGLGFSTLHASWLHSEAHLLIRSQRVPPSEFHDDLPYGSVVRLHADASSSAAKDRSIPCCPTAGCVLLPMPPMLLPTAPNLDEVEASCQKCTILALS